MKQTIKVIAVTAAGFALGYALYGMISKNQSSLVVKEKNGNGANGSASNGNATSPSVNPDKIGDAIAGVLID